MASTSTPADRQERESTNPSPSPSTSVILSSPCLCTSSCFDWVSSFIPWRSVQSKSMASTSTPDLIRQNEVKAGVEGIIEPSASTSTTDRIPENEVMGANLAPPSGCEVMGAFEGIEASASTSTTDLIPENEVMGAFLGIAPSAPTSALTQMQKPRYDVFINHRGPDVKHTLASSIYNVLNNLKVTAFLDSEELEYGDFLPATLEAAMRSASLHIAIFSENYAKSTWCLAELSFMLKTGAKIIPVFYHVDPADLRWASRGKGKYAKAFEEHDHKGRANLAQLQEWKRALHIVSYYNGQIIKTNDDEMRLLKNIVSCVLKEIKNVPLVVAKHPVGLKEIVEDFKVNTLRSAYGDQVVQIVGIWGMGGAGKTTLAKELYNEISSSMERSSFVFDVRDAATKGLLHEKQKKLLNDLGVQGVEFDNIEEGMVILSRGLRSVRVLIVLDDVDNVEQLDALLPTKGSLERGSLIIVTTRAYDVLKSWGISSIYKMRQLDPLYGKQLFCWHAFLKSCPLDGFRELVEKFVKECNGLPLSLKVFGSQLYGESRKEYWESELHKISRILPNDIKQRLKISYDALDDEEKEMFLDIACFFIGEECSLAIEVWNGLGWSGLRSWERLLHKCLVELDNDNHIRIHDHLRDLGRDIANKQSPYRIWFPHQIINVQKQEEKRIGIRGIRATSNQIVWNHFTGIIEPFPFMVKITPGFDGFHVCCSHGKLMINTNGGVWALAPSLVGLKFLVIRGDYFNKVMGEVSGELLWLRWFEIGQRNLPSGLSLKKLRVLELYEDYEGEHHLEELWGETDGEAPVELRELLISKCYKFQGFPNSIGHLNHLKKIVIILGDKFTSLPDEFGLLQSLEHLVFSGCDMLSSLPSNFGNLRNLRYLSLPWCRKLRRLPDSFKNLMLLEYLNLEGCYQLTFTSEDLNILENMTKLEFLKLSYCKQLVELPRHITNQVSLRELYLEGTSLMELPVNIGQLRRLREMRIESVFLTSLPTSLGDLSSLTNLEIRNCPELECLPDSLGDLSSLTNLEILNCPKLECLPDSLGDLSFLTNLEIRVCPELECLPDSFGDLSSLTNLSIEDCSKLGCLPDSLGDLSSLTTLSIRDCPKLERAGVKSLPKSIRQLSNLQVLCISSCPISYLDFGPSGLSNLERIVLRETELCRVSFSEDCCPHLESLYIQNNHHLEEIEALPRTVELISLLNCEMLKNIPSFARLTSLKEFSLRDCYGIEKIEGLENCTRLERLTVNTCWEMPGIESLEHMENLKQLELGANKGSVIERCVQRIQKWPDKIDIRMRVVPDVSSVVHSSLFPNLMVVDSFSNQRFESRSKLVHMRSSNGDAIMLCFVLNCVSSQMALRIGLHLSGRGFISESSQQFEKGRWAWVRVITPPSEKEFSIEEDKYEVSISGYAGEWEGENEVEQGLLLTGEKQRLGEAIHTLLPLLHS